MAQSLEDKVDRVIESLYGALYTPTLWQETLQRFCHAVDSDRGAIHASPQAGEFGSIFLTHNIDPTPILPVIHIYGRQSPFMDRAMQKGVVPGVFVHHDIIPFEELHATEYYREYMAPMEMEHGITAVLRLNQGNDRAPVSISATRRPNAQPYGEEEASVARSLFPHLRRAVRLRLEVDPARMADPAVTEALDGFDTPCCLLGSGGRLIFANAAARAVLADGRHVRSQGGHLVCADLGADRGLGQAIEQVCSPTALWALRSPGEVVVNPEEGEPLLAVVTPLGHDNPFLSVGPIRAAVYLLSPSHRQPDGRASERLRNLFALTPAEIEVTNLILAGQTLEAIADKRGVSIHTIRVQVKAILEKTQSSRQSDLFRLTGLFAGPPN